MDTNSIFDLSNSKEQKRWIDQVSKIFEKDQLHKVENGNRVSIFRVPTTLSAFKPEAYMPQLIGLGPYHHFCPKLYEMERYKLAAARRFIEQFKTIEFKQLVGKLIDFELPIRACYHKYLDFDDDTLSHIMAIDGLFLLDFLSCYIYRSDESSCVSRTAQLVDSTGRKLGSHSILSDLMMLENQIPIFLLRQILSELRSSGDMGDAFLPSMLLCFCKVVNPIKLKEDLPLTQVLGHEHLLDLLYHLIKPKLKGPFEASANQCQNGCQSSFQEIRSLNSSNSQRVFSSLWSILSNLNIGWVKKITKPIKAIVGMPWEMVKGLPENFKSENEIPNEERTIPMAEEIMIPSVSKLQKAGVQFCHSYGDTTSIRFDKKKKTLYLPVIKLNVNSEVIIRNLVAYEASFNPEYLIFTRYIELMCGIIDTTEDAKFLREKKIIVNSLKSDAEVALLFNGMSKSIQLSNVSHIDKTIEEVNRYYHSTRRVRAYDCMKKYVYGSWQILTVLAAVLVIGLMGIQSFCSAYACTRLFSDPANI